MTIKFTIMHKKLKLNVEIGLIKKEDIEGLVQLKEAESPGTEQEKQEYRNYLLSCCKDGVNILVIKEKTKKITDFEVIGNVVLIYPDLEKRIGIYNFNWHRKLYDMNLVTDFFDLFLYVIEKIDFEKVLITIRKEQDISILSEYGFDMFDVNAINNYKIRPGNINFLKEEKFMEFNFTM